MPAHIRLIAMPGTETAEVSFKAAWAAPSPRAAVPSAFAWLDTGDGRIIDLGLLCAPTVVTWCEQRQVELGAHRYTGAGAFTAQLRWGNDVASALVLPGRLASVAAAPAAAALPAVVLFTVSPVSGDPLQRLIKLRVEGLAPGHVLRLDAGAGQAHYFSNAEGEELEIDVAAEIGATYSKPGPYTLMLDLIDEYGFWLANLVQIPIAIADADVEADLPAEPPEPSPAKPGPALSPAEMPAEPQPWLPYRYVKPRYTVSTYAAPGGGAVRRTVNPGIFLSVRAEATANGQTWLKTAQGDWVAASAVTFFRTSELRGVKLGDVLPPPPPPPPPPPDGTRRGIVTATTLNVRARPGVTADNPPIGALRNGAAVTIYAEQRLAGTPWYRIGDGRWVHGGYVRIVSAAEASSPPATPPASEVRRGVVTATTLNVRARPGVAADNPPVITLPSGAEVTVSETRGLSGEDWYCIGESRWVLSRWVRLLPATRSTVATAAGELATQLPAGWVVPATLNVRARPGLAADNPPVGQLVHNQAVFILEERTLAGARWFRIGENQWIEGKNVGVARVKPRPARIGPTERWVGVSLAEQTAVAYEGDHPVYAALIASGLPGTPTVQGVFRTWLRRETGKMAGPGYYIEDVTWTCYFYSGYSLHTAYWHDAFGKPRSHGCVNMSPYDAWWIFQWSAAGGENSPTVYVYWA